ncbi:MAG TPA: fibronectin type III domain-containing protein [Kiritimatiellia bacterium]|nr:fibronectin type III domain-containing protein [Kiritimatiellia bacterium]
MEIPTPHWFRLGLICVLAGSLLVPASFAQQNVYNRNNSGTGNWWSDSPHPWYYQTWNSTENRPDIWPVGTRNWVHYDHNNDLTDTVNGAWFNLISLTFASAASSARTFNKSGDAGISLTGGIYQDSSGTKTFNVPIGVDGSTVAFQANSGAMVFTDNFFLNANNAEFSGSNNNTVSGTVSGSGSITKSGSGQLTLSGDNSFSGGVTQNASGGTLNINHNNALGSGTYTIASGNTFNNTSGSARTVPNNFQINAATTFGGSNPLTISGTFNLGSANRTITVSGSTLTLNGQVTQSSGSRVLTKDGSGTMTLNGSNNHGGTTVSAGTLNVGHANALGSGAFSVGTVTFNNTSGGALSVNNTLTVTGNPTFTGTHPMTITGAGTLTGNRTVTVSANELTLSGALGHNGTPRNLTKAGNGTLTLSGNNTYGGTTTLNAGQLNLNHNNALGGSGALTIQAGTTIDNTSGSSVTIANDYTLNNTSAVTFPGTHPLDFSGTGTLSGNRIVSVTAGTVTFSGELGQNAAGRQLTKQGNGTLVMSGVNTYSGTTTLSAGTILMSGSANSSAFTVASGATLAGGGSVGNLTINGIVSPGNTAGGHGTLNAGTIGLSNGGSYTFDISNVSGTAGTNWDLLSGSGTLTVNASGTFTINVNGNPAGFSQTSSYAWTIMSGSSISGFNVARFAINTSGFSPSFSGTFSIAQSGNNIQLVYTPPAVVPTLTTPTVSSITTGGATLGATVTSDGGAALTSRGTVWGTTANPTGNGLAEGGTSVSAFSHARSGMSVNTFYYYRGYAVNSAGTGYSPDGTFWTLANAPSAPTLSAPTVSGFSVVVNENSNPAATEFAIRVSGQYVQANGTLGASAVWQTKATWGTRTVTGLDVNTQYTVDVKARNGANTETAFGSSDSIWTLANVPSAPTVGSATETSLDVTVNVNGNPAGTQFAIQVDGSDYVKADGTVGAGEVWQTAAQWATITVEPLLSGTEYSFRVKARNGANVETAFSSATALSTLASVDPLLWFPFTGDLPNPSNVFANLSVGNMAISAGSIAYGTAQGTTWTGPSGTPYAQASGGWNGANQAAAKNFNFTLVSTNDHIFSITGIKLLWRRTGAGPTDVGIRIGTSSEFSKSLAQDSTVTEDIAISGYDEQTNATIRIDGWGAATGSGDFRIDDVRIYGSVSPGPVITVTGSLSSFGNVAVSSMSSEQTYSVSGIRLRGNLVVTAPTGFQVSLSSGSGFGASVSLTPSGGTVGSTTIYVRFAPGTTGAFSADIEHTSTLAVTKTQAVSGTGLSAAPTTQAHTISFNTVQTTSMGVAWTSGNGAGRLVIARQGSAPSSGPVPGTTYTADANFGGSGSSLGGGKVVYIGTGNSFTLTGLSAQTQYYLQVYEYNGSGSTINYNTSTASGNPGNRFTLSTVPSGHAGSFGATTASSSQINLSWTAASGPPSGYLILRRVGANPTGTPNNGQGYSVSDTIGDGTVAAIVTPGSATSVNITGLNAGTTYHFSIIPFNWNGSSAQTYHYRTAATIPTANATTFAAEPTTQASNITFPARTQTSLDLSWTSGNGARRIVVMRAGAAVSWTPSDGTPPSGVSHVFTSASDQGSGNRIVYDWTGNSLTVTGLTPNTTYHVRVFEYNGSMDTVNYLTSTASGNPASHATADREPGIGVGSGLTPSATVGSNPSAGSFVVTNIGGSALSYAISTNASWLAVSPVVGTSVAGGGTVSHTVTYTVAGLGAGTHDAIITVTGTGTGENAATNSPRTVPVTLTLNAIPNPSSATVSGQGSEYVNLTWTKHGSHDVMIVYQAGAAPATPVQGTSYSVGGSVAGGGTVIYKGAGAALEHIVAPGATHHYAFYSINNNHYSSGLTGSATLAAYPSDVSIEPFAYTNTGTLATSGQGNGGTGWGGSWYGDAGDFHLNGGNFANQANYPNGAGNKIRVTPPNDQSRFVYRELDQVYNNGQIYVGFIMNYQWDGPNKFAGLSLFWDNSSEKLYFGEIYGQNKVLGINGPSVSETGSSYTLENGAGNDYIIIAKYDWVTEQASVIAYHIGSQTVPTTEPGSWAATVSASSNNVGWVNSIRIGAGAGSGFGTPGDVFFDEIRVASSWADLIGVEVTMNDPSAATATADGNELVRLNWTKHADHNVMILHRGTNAAAAPVQNTAYNVGDAVGTDGTRVIYKGAGSHLDHVVPPGFANHYRFVSYSGNIYSTGLTANVSMGSYFAGEVINPFSYTNNTALGADHRGGQGFGTHYWTTGGSGSWMVRTNPASATGDAPRFFTPDNYPEMAGYLVRVESLGNNQQGFAERSLGETYSTGVVYVAFMMSYQYDGANKWAGLSFYSGSSERAFFGKGGGGNFHTFAIADGTTTWMSGENLRGTHTNDGRGDTGRVYLVVGKYDFENDRLQGLVYNQITGALPESEPGSWHITQNGVSFASFDRIRLKAGSSDAGAAIGSAQFDEIRIARQWSDLVAGVCPTWVGNAERDPSGSVWLGDRVGFKVESYPIGPGQAATLNVTYADSSTDGFGMQFWKFESNNTFWTNWVQMGKTGTHSFNFTVAVGTCDESGGSGSIVVQALNNPSAQSAVVDAVNSNSQINLSWTKNAQSHDVMVIRKLAADSWTEPTQGVTYNPGDPIGSGIVVYRGPATSFNDSGLAADTTYDYKFYSENWGYYSAGVTASATTEEGVQEITIDGNPVDWVGARPTPINSGRVSAGEYIWRDKTGEQRRDNNDHTNADIEEFRVFADSDYIYFLVKMTNITDQTHPHIAIGVDTRMDAGSQGVNWIGDDSQTFVGSDYFGGSAAVRFPEYQLGVHYVTADGTVQVEMWDRLASPAPRWRLPSGAQAAISTTHNAIEIRVARSAMNLDGTKTARFTVASFLNTGSWNNDGAGTRFIADNTPHVLDSISIMRYGEPDNDYTRSAWSEDLSDSDIDFFFDVRLGTGGVIANIPPTKPGSMSPTNQAVVNANPTLSWSASTDSDGEVTSYLLEVSERADFNGVEGTENGSIYLRVNLPHTQTSYNLTTISTQYYWRVRARDTSGELSAGDIHQFRIVDGKLDNDGPLPTLLYIGTDVDGFLAGDFDERIEKFGFIQDVLDSEIKAGDSFGFVLRWEDPSGVYATNRQHGGGSNPGHFTWNIVSDDGRVSPNWDIIEYQYDEIGGTLTNTYEWGIDVAFHTSNTWAQGNADPTITNFVFSAFVITNYNPNTEYFLTVSAEDSYTEGGSWWSFGSWNSFGAPDGAPLFHRGGWALDGPNTSRNVTTNHLIRIVVRDDDSDPPIASTMAAWGNRSMIISNATTALSASGSGQSATYTITDGALAQSSVLTFGLNVWDRYTGIQRGTTPTTTLDGNIVTNTSLTIGDWQVDNTANYATTPWSTAATDHDAAVTTWRFTGVGHSDITTLWGTNVHAATGQVVPVTVELFDADNDRPGDQSSQELTMGFLQVIDDDTEPPEIAEFTVAGSGITADGLLPQGGIAVIGVNGNPPITNNVQTFSFVVLSPFPEQTQIWFTDAGWSNNATQAWANINEFHLASWISVGGAAVGDVITLPIININNAGDQVAVYQYVGSHSNGPIADPANVRWIYALNMGSAWLDNHPGGVGTNNQNSALYYGLTNEYTAIDVIGTGANRVNWQYTGPRIGTASDLLRSISTRANWQQMSSSTTHDLATIFAGGFTVLGPGDIPWDTPILTDAQINQGGYAVTGIVRDVTTGIQPTGTSWAPPPYFTLFSHEDVMITSNHFSSGFSVAANQWQTGVVAAAGALYDDIVLGEHIAYFVVSDADNDRQFDNQLVTNTLAVMVVDDDPYPPRIGSTRMQMKMGSATLTPTPGGNPELLGYWNFNETNFNRAAGTTGVMTDNFTTNEWFGGETLNALFGDADGVALSPQGTVNNGNHFQIELDMSDAMSLVVTYATRGTSQGYTTHDWRWSTDGISFTSIGQITGRNVTAWSVQTADFTSVSALNGSATVFIRCVLTGASAANGNNRFDNLQLNALPLSQLLFEVTDAQLAEINASNPLEFRFNVYDPISGVARGEDDVDMVVTIDGLFDNDANFNAGLSSNDTFSANSFTVWSYDTVIPYEDRGVLYGDGTTLRDIVATFADMDDDRPNDRSWVSNAVFGALRIIDDDEDPPEIRTHRFGGTGATPLRAFQVTTNVTTPQVLTSSTDPWVRGPRIVGGSSSSTGTIFVLTDAEMANPDAAGIRFAFGALDEYSGVSRGTSGSTNEVMSFSLGNIIQNNISDFDPSLSTAGNPVNQILTNVWSLNRTWSLEDVTTMVEGGDLRVTVTIPDLDDDRPNDRATIFSHQVGFIRVVDDDIRPPLMSPIELNISSVHNLFAMGFEAEQGWTNFVTAYASTVDGTTNHIGGDVWVSKDAIYTALTADTNPSGVRSLAMRNQGAETAWLQMPLREDPGTLFVWSRLSGAGSREVVLEGRQDPGDAWTNFGTRNVTNVNWELLNWPVNEDGEWTLRIRRTTGGGTPTVYLDDLILTKKIAWTNVVNMDVTFADADDQSGIYQYRAVQNVSAPLWQGGTNVLEGSVLATNAGTIALSEGVVTGFVFAVDNDNDRPGDRMRNPGIPYVVRVDRTPPPAVQNLRATDAVGGDIFDLTIDETSEIKVEWSAFATEAVAAGPRSDDAELSPWDTYIVTYYQVDDVTEQPVANAITTVLTRTTTGWTNVLHTHAFTNLVISNLDFDTYFRIHIQGRDKAGNVGDAVSAIGNTDRFSVTQGVNRVSLDLEVFWTGYEDRWYDVLYVDTASGFHNGLSNAWGHLLLTNRPAMYDTGSVSRARPGELTGTTYRFYRVARPGAWQVTNSVRRASQEIYVTKALPLVPGENWHSLFFEPDTNTLSYVFGTNILAGGVDFASSPKISWYNSTIQAGQVVNVATMQVYLRNDHTWRYQLGGPTVDALADHVPIPLRQTFNLELPPTAQPANLVLIGQVPTEDVVIGPLAGSVGVTNYHLISHGLPSRTRLADMNFHGSGIRTNHSPNPTAFIPALHGMPDEIRILDNTPNVSGHGIGSQRSPARRYYMGADGNFYRWVGRALANNDVIDPSDSLVIVQYNHNGVITWTNRMMYSQPGRNFNP